jgi:hypothetical protein
MPDVYPVAYRDLAEQYGAPASIEDARLTWSHVVKGAETGTVITLIAPGGPGRGGWAAVVPVSEVADPGRCPVWPVSDARPKLGDVVNAATDYLEPIPQILARHRQQVAAVIAARALEDRPADAERIDIQALLEQGGRVTLEYDPGQSGYCDEQGDVIDPPVAGGFAATALDWQDAVIGYGSGDTIAEALLRVRRRPPFPEPEDSSTYTDEPPF